MYCMCSSHTHTLPMFNIPLSISTQTMAIATLALCYNNPRVFTGVVKIRKGQAVDLIMQSTNMANVEAIFARFADKACTLIDAPPRAVIVDVCIT